MFPVPGPAIGDDDSFGSDAVLCHVKQNSIKDEAIRLGAGGQRSEV